MSSFGPAGDTSISEPLTLAVITLIGGAALASCLRSSRMIAARRIVIGPRRLSEGVLQDFPGVEQIDSDAFVPERRALGLREADTEWVALVEDTCALSADWLVGAHEAQRTNAGPAWGGPVTLALELPPRQMALGCTEYGEYSAGNWQRLARGPEVGRFRSMTRIAGACLLYRRSVVTSFLTEGGLVEPELHAALAEAGYQVHLHPALEVTYIKGDENGATVTSRFAHGRIYGGSLAERSGLARRLFGAAKCLALPAVLFTRAARGLPTVYRHRIVACAWIAVFATAWAAGELTGLLVGRAKRHSAWG